jgi:hypothetical protein
VLSFGLAAAGCSGGDRDDAGPVVAGPSQVTAEASSAPSGVVTAAVAPTTALTTAGTVATTPPTLAPTTPAPTSPPPAPAGEYAPAPSPAYPTRSAPPPAGTDLPDGAYYVVVEGANAGPPPALDVTIYQLLTGPDAIAAAQADGQGLDSDVYVRPDPAAARHLELTPALAVSVAQPDRPEVSYAVSGAELARLVAGAPPAPGAPGTYRYVPFPFLVTVQGGVPVSVEQLWSP